MNFFVAGMHVNLWALTSKWDLADWKIWRRARISTGTARN